MTKTINLVATSNLTGISKWITSLNKKQRAIADYLRNNQLVKETIKDSDQLFTAFNKISSLDLGKMYAIVPISDTEYIDDTIKYLESEWNENGTTIGFNKLVKLTDDLVLIYTKNKIHVKASYVFNPFKLGRYWVGMSN